MESLASLPVFSSRRAQGMELSGHGGDMAIPISSVHDSPPLHHHHHHHHQVLSNGPPLPPPPPPPLLVLPVASGGATEEQQQCGGRKAAAKYRECLKNHAASIGGNATDGCGEFMPSGEEGSLEALKCSACGCHRNFHRKEAEGEEQLPSPLEYLRPLSLRGSDARKVAVGSAPRFLLPGPNHYHQFLPRVAAPHGMIMPLQQQQQQQQQTSDSEEMEVARPAALMMKKRFRTKFTAEQKEKMLGFAEKAGWRLQKQEDSVVQQFCQEIGVKRRVLKVWMHNNKHNLAKKHPPPPHLSPL